jgi:O-antigen/teichoic acid export membrane protein
VQDIRRSLPDFSLRRVFGGASLYSIGEVLVRASGFFLIPVFTRVLSPEDYGIIGYLQVFLQVLTAVTAFGFHGAQTRYLYDNPDDATRFGQFAFTINLVPVALGVVVLAPLTILSAVRPWSVGRGQIPFSPFMTLTLWTVIFQVVANNAISYYQAKQRFAACTVLQVLRFILVSALSLVLILGFDMGALGRVAGMFGGLGLFLFVAMHGYARTFVWRPSVGALRYAAAFGAPVVVHLVTGTVHNALDRFVLESYVPLEQLGIYTLAYTVGQSLNMFVAAFNQAYQPSYFQLMSSDREDKDLQVTRVFRLWLVLLTALAVAAIILGPPFLSVFAGPAFGPTSRIFPWIMLAVFTGSF